MVARVKVVDIAMPFRSMVTFMVTWTIAAIPALLILAFVGVVFGFVFGGLVSSCSGGRIR